MPRANRKVSDELIENCLNAIRDGNHTVDNIAIVINKAKGTAYHAMSLAIRNGLVSKRMEYLSELDAKKVAIYELTNQPTQAHMATEPKMPSIKDYSNQLDYRQWLLKMKAIATGVQNDH